MQTRSARRDHAWKGAKVLVLSPTPTHPQDYGNRKRIYATCANLMKRGAQITFLHYPSEAEWRTRLPAAAEAEMIRSWHRYYLLPATRGLHPAPRGSHHTIDEWWDDAIGAFLTWIFSVETFDAFIVNYTWLSKAFEFAPRPVVKILDTNDRFAGRKEVLQRNGIAPEFFYTTDDQESIGLKRADIVWAIKDEERREFERIADVPVLTMLHLDENSYFPVPPPDPDGYLRAGIIGARNNINLVNLRSFLAQAIPIFERFFAPIRLVVAGTICTLLKDVRDPFVQVMGEVTDVDDFYRAIDIACIPVGFSTGLKIKAGEAISRGFPLMSLAHAFEGYPARHAFHTLGNFREMAEKLVDVAFDRDLLRVLRTASIGARETVAQSIEENLEKSWEIVRRSRQYVLHCVDARALLPKGPFRAVLDSVAQFLGPRSDLAVVVVDGPVEGLTRSIPELANRPRIAIAAELVEDKPLAAALERQGFEIVPFADAVARFGPDVVVADALAPSMSHVKFSDATMIYRGEMVAQGVSAGTAPNPSWIVGKFHRVIAVGYNRSRGLEILGRELGADVVTAPSFWRSGAIHNQLVHPRVRERNMVSVLDSGGMIGAELVCELLVELRCRPVLVGLTAPSANGLPPVRGVSVLDYVEELFDVRRPLPHFVVDLSFGALGLQFARELLQRLDVPLITAETRLDQPAITGPPPPGRASTVVGLIQEIVSELACEPGTPNDAVQAIGQELNGDSGWSWLWQVVANLRSGQFEEFL